MSIKHLASFSFMLDFFHPNFVYSILIIICNTWNIFKHLLAVILFLFCSECIMHWHLISCHLTENISYIFKTKKKWWVVYFVNLIFIHYISRFMSFSHQYYLWMSKKSQYRKYGLDCFFVYVKKALLTRLIYFFYSNNM